MTPRFRAAQNAASLRERSNRRALGPSAGQRPAGTLRLRDNYLVGPAGVENRHRTRLPLLGTRTRGRWTDQRQNNARNKQLGPRASKVKGYVRRRRTLRSDTASGSSGWQNQRSVRTSSAPFSSVNTVLKLLERRPLALAVGATESLPTVGRPQHSFRLLQPGLFAARAQGFTRAPTGRDSPTPLTHHEHQGAAGAERLLALSRNLTSDGAHDWLHSAKASFSKSTLP